VELHAVVWIRDVLGRHHHSGCLHAVTVVTVVTIVTIVAVVAIFLGPDRTRGIRP
jgi:hypothetical protein